MVLGFSQLNKIAARSEPNSNLTFKSSLINLNLSTFRKKKRAEVIKKYKDDPIYG